MISKFTLEYIKKQWLKAFEGARGVENAKD